jgi:hypothetical protein
MPRDEFQPALPLVEAKHPSRPRRQGRKANQGQHRTSQRAAADWEGVGYIRHLVQY